LFVPTFALPARANGVSRFLEDGYSGLLPLARNPASLSGRDSACEPEPRIETAPRKSIEGKQEMDFIDVMQNRDELMRILVAAGLATRDDVPVVHRLTGGVSSGIFRIDLPSGSYCLKQALPALKVPKEWIVPVDRVFAETNWLRVAREIAPNNVPRVLAEDTKSRSFVMEFLGDNFRNWKTELLAGRIEPRIGKEVGHVLGRIHSATAGIESLRARFAYDDNFYALRLEPYLVETARVHPALAPQLEALVERTRHTKRALVHGDVSPKNILLGDEGPVLLDAECAWYGDPAFDLAFCLNHLLLKCAHMPHSTERLISVFDSLLGAYRKHVDFEPTAEVEMRAALLLPALALARVDGKSPVEYLDETNRVRVRRMTYALVETPVMSLEEVKQHWLERM
jgi:aminoglycoside phosphotransferase (APT) family kinase protein